MSDTSISAYTRSVTRERRIEAALVHGVEALGGMAIKLVPTRSGIPDRLVLWSDGTHELVELKRPGGIISPVQRVWHDRLSRIGHSVTVLDSLDAVETWLDSRQGEIHARHRRGTSRRP